MGIAALPLSPHLAELIECQRLPLKWPQPLLFCPADAMLYHNITRDCVSTQCIPGWDMVEAGHTEYYIKCDPTKRFISTCKTSMTNNKGDIDH